MPGRGGERARNQISSQLKVGTSDPTLFEVGRGQACKVGSLQMIQRFDQVTWKVMGLWSLRKHSYSPSSSRVWTIAWIKGRGNPVLSHQSIYYGIEAIRVVMVAVFADIDLNN